MVGNAIRGGIEKGRPRPDGKSEPAVFRWILDKHARDHLKSARWRISLGSGSQTTPRAAAGVLGAVGSIRDGGIFPAFRLSAHHARQLVADAGFARSWPSAAHGAP